MGCADSKQKEEEQVLAEQEMELGFKGTSVATIDFVIRKYSQNGLLNIGQFEDVVRALGLVTVNRRNSSNITGFYETFKTPNSCYDAKLLIILGILLGFGRVQEKARLLYEIYDIDNTHSLSLDDAAKMVDDLYEVAIVRLPTLVTADLGELDFIKVRTYIDQIKFKADPDAIRDIAKSHDRFRVVDMSSQSWGWSEWNAKEHRPNFPEVSVRAKQLKGELLKTITGGQEEITLDGFMKVMCSSDYQRLSTSSGLREYFYKTSRSTPSTAHFDAARIFLESQPTANTAGSNRYGVRLS